MAGKKIKYEGLQIPNARFFDLENTFSDTSSKLPHTFPSQDKFIEESRKLGINNSSKIVVYDNIGNYTSPRVWWMYTIFGHENIAVLDGGLTAWVEGSYKTEKLTRRNYPKGDFSGELNRSKINTLEEMVQNIETKQNIVIDARSKGRFDGTAPEPRDWVVNGHIPGSLNLPFDEVLDGNKFKSKEALQEIFSSLKIDERPISFVCGSGLTSCIILMASEIAQENDCSVYDGSWTEWGSSKGLAIERSA